MRFVLLALGLCFVLSCPVVCQEDTRSVHGTVSDHDGKPLNGAAVQLKNVRSLQIRSFLTEDGGHFFFHGLDPDIDYELQAEYKTHRSSTKMLSKFNSKKDADVDLKVDIGR